MICGACREWDGMERGGWGCQALLPGEKSQCYGPTVSLGERGGPHRFINKDVPRL